MSGPYTPRPVKLPQPMKGVRVLSIAQNLPGPTAARKMADWGAAVTKVEPPQGDPMAGNRAWYDMLHKGFEKVVLNLKDSADRKKLDSYLEKTDLLLASTRAKTLASWGLDWPTVSKQFPKLCYIAITGYSAPLEDMPGHDLNYQASVGLVDPPFLPINLFADMVGAERAAAMGMALVWDRDKTGKAAYLPVPLADVIWDIAEPVRRGSTGGKDRGLGGKLPIYNLYEAKEGWIALGALEPRLYKGIQKELGIPDLQKSTLENAFKARTAQEWQDWGLKYELPVTVVKTD